MLGLSKHSKISIPFGAFVLHFPFVSLTWAAMPACCYHSAGAHNTVTIRGVQGTLKMTAIIRE